MAEQLSQVKVYLHPKSPPTNIPVTFKPTLSTLSPSITQPTTTPPRVVIPTDMIDKIVNEKLNGMMDEMSGEIIGQFNVLTQSIQNISQSVDNQNTIIRDLNSLSRSIGSNKIFVNKEIPFGEVDGINTTYYLQYCPTLGSDHLYLNGLLIKDGSENDYTISGSTIMFENPLPEGMKLHCTYYYSDNTPSKVFVDKETPLGHMNGINNTFILEYSPADNSEHIYLNGLLQEGNGNDYSISGSVITFLKPPKNNYTLRCTYYYYLT
jgi:hypothetical protein